MSAYYTTFTFTCQTCGETVQVTDGQQEDHPCPESPVAAVVSGCDTWAQQMRRDVFGDGQTAEGGGV